LKSLSDPEILSLLAEAKTLQHRYGISLKDACHRLYLAEISKLEAIDTAEKTMAVIRSRLDKTRKHETLAPIHEIDIGAFDAHILPHGAWPDAEWIRIEVEWYLYFFPLYATIL
jgi:hypothetical protein